MREALKTVPGVRDIDVEYENNLVRVGYERGAGDVNAMVAAIRDAGFKSWPTDTETRKTN